MQINVNLRNIPIRLLLVILGLVLLCIYIWLSTKPSPAAQIARSHPKHFTVKVVRPVIKPMSISMEEVGNVEAAQTVNILPQASGILKKIAFTPGEYVKQGQLLFELDPGIYATNVEQAKANLARDQAQFALLQATATRYANLAKLEYVTVQQYEEAKAAALAQAAVVAADQAFVKQMEIQLGYTLIYAPISGKTSSTNVYLGDLISANSSAPLVVIKKMDPVQISFSVPQDKLPDLLKYKQQNSLSVEILAEGTDHVVGAGQLSLINNTVNPQTGTVELKAQISNPALSLWPGQLVRVRLILAVQPKAMVIPSSAVQVGQQGAYVYLVKQGKAVVQPVSILQEVKGEAVITQGLKGEESVITEIPVGLKSGANIQMSS